MLITLVFQKTESLVNEFTDKFVIVPKPQQSDICT